MKLKNVKKLLGDEVYPLWLENILEYNSAFLDLDNEEGGVVHLSGCNLIKLAFEWGYTAQGYWFWLNLNSEFISELPWMFCRRPLTELSCEDYKKSWYFRKDQGRTCIAYLMYDNSMRVHAGCFEGTLQEFEERAFDRYGNNTSENYAKHIAWLKDLQSNNSNN